VINHYRRRYQGIRLIYRNVEQLFDSINHGFGALDLGRSMSRCGFYIHDHAMLDINQVVRGIGEKR